MQKLKYILLAFVVAFSFSFTQPAQASTAKQLEVHFINVGQGDSTLIKAANGKTMLIDGGPSVSGTTVVNYLKKQGVKKLDYVVATHPDADHIGGLINVLNSFKVGTFIDSGKTHTSATYEKMMKLIKTKKITYKVPALLQTFTLDTNAKVQVLHVDKKAKDTNDASLVLRLTHNKQIFLMMGDASTEIEAKLMNKYQLKANVLKVGHHGSNTSSNTKFITKVKPVTAIVSAGKKNSYGHPHASVLKSLKNVGAKTYNTIDHCNVVVKSTGTSHKVTTSCTAKAAAATTTTPVKTTTTVKTNFANCTELRKVYPKGVPSTHPAYQAKMDRDKDGYACEL